MLTKTRIGPRHHGRKMSLKAFEFAHVEAGYLYELARGYIVVSEVAYYYHAMQVTAIKQALLVYRDGHPGAVHAVLSGSDCKLLMLDWES